MEIISADNRILNCNTITNRFWKRLNCYCWKAEVDSLSSPSHLVLLILFTVLLKHFVRRRAELVGQWHKETKNIVQSLLNYFREKMNRYKVPDNWRCNFRIPILQHDIFYDRSIVSPDLSFFVSYSYSPVEPLSIVKFPSSGVQS